MDRYIAIYSRHGKVCYNEFDELGKAHAFLNYGSDHGLCFDMGIYDIQECKIKRKNSFLDKNELMKHVHKHLKPIDQS